MRSLSLVHAAAPALTTFSDCLQRCVIAGNTISAILGVCVAKLFLYKPGFAVGDIFGVNWACALSLSLSPALSPSTRC